MSYQLTFGGGETILIRDKGTANAVQGFVSNEVVVIKNITALATTFIFSLLNYIQFSLSGLTGTIVWRNVSGVWRAGMLNNNVSGTWKQDKTFIKVSGNWK